MAIASAALDEYRVESKKMVIALVDMEMAFIPPQHFIRLVQRRYVYSNRPQVCSFMEHFVDCVVYHV